jgi:hypothetical protein
MGKRGPLLATIAAPMAENFLPQQADDGTVKAKVLTIFDQVSLHVDNFYRDAEISVTPSAESQLSRFSTPFLSRPLAGFLESTPRKSRLIKHALAYHIINMTAASCEYSMKLLPLEISLMLTALGKAQQQGIWDKCECVRRYFGRL